ncbi:MAG: FlgO family outer membrane protein [Thioalkalispiraceae bacterium]|jgi:TolB-like protein/DNA-binding winged helix-turn-helix (wHTH) protein/Flp pilus assembly protein TadD
MTTAGTGTDPRNFHVAEWEVRPQAGEICRQGQVVKLEPRVMDLLQLLASQPGKVFSRIQLEETIWPGTVVGYDALTKSVGKLRDALGDNHKPFSYIETIPKKGYRLIAPVTTGHTPLNTTPDMPVSPGNLKRIGAVGLVLVVVLVSLLLFTPQPSVNQLNTTTQQVTDKPSLIVMPFKNLDNDPQQQYFSQGITDDLITDLSGYSGFEVINSRTAFQYQDRDIDLKTLVNNHGVKYVIEGTLRRTRQNIRINVQMIDTERGTNLWAEQYNQPLSALFDIQDNVRSQIVSALSVKLGELKRRREQNRYTNNFDAYDAFLRGQSDLIKRASAKDNRQAREHFERAIAIDPDFARAYAALAMANADAYRHEWADDPDVAARIALQQSKHALKLDPGSPHVTLAMGYVQFFVAGDHEQAALMAERTLQLDPQNADANMLLAAIYVHAGKYDKAEAYVESSMRLTPDHASIYYAIGALANLLRSDYPKAKLLYEKSLRINPERLIGKIYMAITLVRMKQINEAKWYADEIMASSPGFNAEKWAAKQPYQDRRINRQILNDLRKAGLR